MEKKNHDLSSDSFFSTLFQEKELFLIDVRSPGEFAQGHIDGAINLPLFSNEQRAQVGTTYKKEGKRSAIEKGLSLISLSSFVEQIKNHNLPQKVALYCARGGMRSQSMGWLLSLLGHEVRLISGGYKAFRNWVVASFQIPYSFFVLSGKTGAGKSDLLHALKKEGGFVLDLEDLAKHQGSVFGFLSIAQPTQEHFENLLAKELFSLKVSLFLVEDESRFIGKLRIPDGFFNQMQQAKVLLLSTSIEDRIKRIVENYSSLNIDDLSRCVMQLKKSLGDVAMKKTLQFLQEKNFYESTRLLLHYYDKRYDNALKKRDPKTIYPIDFKDTASISSQMHSLLCPKNPF
jgi:tRNA 2-selenouridine synthase